MQLVCNTQNKPLKTTISVASLQPGYPCTLWLKQPICFCSECVSIPLYILLDPKGEPGMTKSSLTGFMKENNLCQVPKKIVLAQA